MVFHVIANIMARNPPSIAIALGGIGSMLSMPYAVTIFWTGVGLQAAWLGLPLIRRFA